MIAGLAETFNPGEETLRFSRILRRLAKKKTDPTYYNKTLPGRILCGSAATSFGTKVESHVYKTNKLAHDSTVGALC